MAPRMLQAAIDTEVAEYIEKHVAERERPPNYRYGLTF